MVSAEGGGGGIIFLQGAGRGDRGREGGRQVILTGQMERSGVGFEVLDGGEADLAKLSSLASSDKDGLLLLFL